MKNNKGFLLFAFSVYLACVFLLCTLLFSLLYTSYKHLLYLRHRHNALQDIEKAQWHITRLLENTHNNLNSFTIFQNDYLVWIQNNHGKGLLYDSLKRKLFYLQGTYNPQTQHLAVREKNLILEENIVEFNYDTKPFCIMCTIKNE